MDAQKINNYDSYYKITLVFEELAHSLIESKPFHPYKVASDCFAKIHEEPSLSSNEEIKNFIKDFIKKLSENNPSSENGNNAQPAQAESTLARKRSRNDFDSFKPPYNNENSPRDLLPCFRKASISLNSGHNRMRRGSVSAESIQPTDTEYTKIVINKSTETKMRIASAISSNLLFRNLEVDQKREIVDAMFEKTVEKDEIVIKQGEEGDNFYVVAEGTFDIYVNSKKVVQVSQGGSFGELALMYNTKRAATVQATASGILWAVDRTTFRRTITNNIYRKRRLYENFLQSIPLLQSLNSSERAKICDALEPLEFEKGDTIIEQNSKGDYFYMIEKGKVSFSKHDQEDNFIELGEFGEGRYFGELAFINNHPRAATVVASTDVRLATLSKDAFVRLLGPVVDIMKRNMANYSYYQPFMN